MQENHHRRSARHRQLPTAGSSRPGDLHRQPPSSSRNPLRTGHVGDNPAEDDLGDVTSPAEGERWLAIRGRLHSKHPAIEWQIDKVEVFLSDALDQRL